MSGDPLGLAPTLRALGEAGELARTASPPTRWYARTAGHTYPDALANLYESLYARACATRKF